MDQETNDLWFGAVLLAVFLVTVFGTGKLLTAVKRNQYKRLLGTLAPIIEGTTDGDMDKGWMQGHYRGRIFWIVLFPKRNMYSGQSGFKYNSFTVTLKEVPGQQDWSLNYGAKNPLQSLRSKPGWYVTTDNTALRVRLENPALIAEVEATVQGWGQGRIVSYTRSNASLAYDADVSPRLVPTEAQFRTYLNLLLRLADINAETNSLPA